MATNLTDTTYCAPRDSRIFRKLLFTSDIYKFFTIIDNVKSSRILNTAEITDNILQFDGGAGCGFNPQGDIKFSERMLDVKPFAVNFEQCLKDFENTWISEIMKPGANLTEMPTEVEEQILYLLGKKISKEVANKVWNATGSATEIQGLIPMLDADADTVKVSTPISLNKSNVLGEIERVFLAQSEDVLGDSEVGANKFIVSYKTHTLIKLALADVSNQVISTNWLKDGDRITYMDYEVMVAPEFPNNTVIFANLSRNIIGVDLVSDETTLEVGMYPKPNHDKYFVMGRMRLGVQSLFPSEVVLYKA